MFYIGYCHSYFTAVAKLFFYRVEAFIFRYLLLSSRIILHISHTEAMAYKCQNHWQLLSAQEFGQLTLAKLEFTESLELGWKVIVLIGGKWVTYTVRPNKKETRFISEISSLPRKIETNCMLHYQEHFLFFHLIPNT